MTLYGVHEQWVYARFVSIRLFYGYWVPDRYAYLEDGILVSWQE